MHPDLLPREYRQPSKLLIAGSIQPDAHEARWSVEDSREAASIYEAHQRSKADAEELKAEREAIAADYERLRSASDAEKTRHNERMKEFESRSLEFEKATESLQRKGGELQKAARGVLEGDSAASRR